MNLTTAQLQTLKAAIAAETDSGFVALRTEGATGAMADWLNVDASPDFMLWRSDAPVKDILNNIDLDAYTPNDNASETLIDIGRSFRAEIKQINLQILLQGRTEIDASLVTVRKALRDAVMNIPTGSAGANKNAAGNSGANALNACTRKATRGEKVFATGSATTGSVTANVVSFTGRISNETVLAALAS